MKEINNETKNVINDKATVEATSGKVLYTMARVKDVIAIPDAQIVLKNNIEVPEIIMPKKIGNPSKEHHNQRVEAMVGTTMEDAFYINFVIHDDTGTCFLDPIKSINKKYRIIDYTLGLDANMSGKNFQGYSAIGLKLTVTKIEEVKGK